MDTCPYCGEEAYAEYVDVGVGIQQVSPFQCSSCQAQQGGSCNFDNMTPIERFLCWYQGTSPVIVEDNIVGFRKWNELMEELRLIGESEMGIQPIEFYLEARDA